MAKVNLATQIEEVQRELNLRYAGVVPATAQQIATLEAVMATLVWLAFNREAVLAAKEKGPEGPSQS